MSIGLWMHGGRRETEKSKLEKRRASRYKKDGMLKSNDVRLDGDGLSASQLSIPNPNEVLIANLRHAKIFI